MNVEPPLWCTPTPDPRPSVTPFHWFLLVLLIVVHSCSDWAQHDRIQRACATKPSEEKKP